jgi:predicted phosphatase
MAPAVPEPSLTALVHLIAEQALMAFGVPHPQLGRGPAPNPEAARFYTALLRELKVKTEGNRTPEENLLLDEVLDHLRMRDLGLEPAPALKEVRA